MPELTKDEITEFEYRMRHGGLLLPIEQDRLLAQVIVLRKREEAGGECASVLAQILETWRSGVSNLPPCQRGRPISLALDPDVVDIIAQAVRHANEAWEGNKG